MLIGCSAAGRLAAAARVPGERPLDGPQGLAACGILWRAVAADWDAPRHLCRLGGPQGTRFGGLWQPVAADWDALRNLCRLGGPQTSDHQMLGSSDGQILEIISGKISDHQLFASAARG